MGKTYYELLDIPCNATPEEIYNSYRRQVVACYVDKVDHLDPEVQQFARAKASRLNEAYEILRDPKGRAEYDDSIRRTSPFSVRRTSVRPVCRIYVLIVSNEPLLSDLLGEALRKDGYEVLIGQGGEEASALLDQGLALIILDVQGPGMDDFAFLREVRRVKPEAPILVLTSLDDKETEEAARELGVTNFLRKSLGWNKIEQSIRELLSKGLPEGPQEPQRILVVDDEPEICSGLENFLVSDGYRVATALNGREALRKVEIERPHLMLLDLRMPAMNGIEVLKKIKKNKNGFGIIVVSAVEDEALRKLAIDLGAFDCVSKPVDLDTLAVLIRTKLSLLAIEGQPWWKRVFKG